MEHSIRRAGIFVLFFWLFAGSTVVAQPKFYAKADQTKVEAGYSVGVSFILENAEGSQFKPPIFEGFQVLSGPNIQFSTTIVNGRASQKQVWSYMLMPLAPGRYTIGSASIQTSSGRLESQATTLEVTGASAATSSVEALAEAGTDVFIQTYVKSDTVYLGQAVRLEHTLFAKVPVESFQLLQEPQYKGFFAQEMQRFDTRNGTKKLGKQVYATRILHAVSLLPQETGDLSIDPASYQIGVVEQNAKTNMRDPFGRYLAKTFKPVTLQSTKAQMTVLPLPEGAPAHFCGLVGNYTLEANLDKNKVSTDDAILVTLRLTGNSDPKRMRLIELEIPEGLEAYPPKLVSDEVFESDNDGFYHEATIEYYIVPKSAGSYTFQPKISVFDPESKQYVYLKSETLTVDVNKGLGLGAANSSTISGDKWLSPQTKTGLLWLLPILFLSFLAWRMMRKTNAKEMVTAAPPQSQPAVTKHEEPEINPVPVPKVSEPTRPMIDHNEEPPLFYKNLEQLIYTQVRAHLGRPDTHPKELKQYLSQKGTETSEQLLKYLSQCEMVQFGGLRPNASQDEVFLQVRELLEQL